MQILSPANEATADIHYRAADPVSAVIKEIELARQASTLVLAVLQSRFDCFKPSLRHVSKPEAEQILELSARLVPVLARSTSWEAPRVENLMRLSGGASRETWRLDVVHSNDARHRLVLQCKHSFVAGDWADTAVEAQLLKAAAESGVPTPRLVAWSADTAEIGLPYLLVEHIDGETIPQRILRKPHFAAARSKLAHQYGKALGQIQQIRPQSVPGLEQLDPLLRSQQILADIGEPSPVLALGIALAGAQQTHQCGTSRGTRRFSQRQWYCGP